MNKRDALELKRRYVKDCTIKRLAGCYVDCNKNKVLEFNEHFLNMDEEELFKYLDIAKKCLSGTIGNNILELSFPAEEEEPGGRQQFLMGLRESRLENPEILERLYEQIIEKYSYEGNYLILVFHDVYDVVEKTKDNLELDESVEVYDYLLCAICPVDLSKPGLGYRPDQNRIGARIRDWVVGVPDVGFLFPAFDNRSADIHKLDYYVKDAKSGHPEVPEEILGCTARRTAVQQRKSFAQIVKRAVGLDEDKSEALIMDIQESFNDRVEESNRENADKEILAAPIVLDDDIMREVLEENKIEEDVALEIVKNVKEEFADETPTVENLVDTRAIKANAPVKRERELLKEVISLKNRLSGEGYDLVLNCSPEMAEEVHSQVIDERRYILIPVIGNEHISVNGIGQDCYGNLDEQV